MLHLTRSPTSILNKSVLTLAFGALISFAISGCGEQAAFGPAASSRLPPMRTVIVTPHDTGPGRVTTASWYGPGFHGHPTSSGELYNQHAMTAASRTLPIGSQARVTNLTSGESVVVRINDRGPFVRGRGIDLSRAAARRIGIDHSGTAKVRVARIDRPSNTPVDTGVSTAKLRGRSSVNYASTASVMESGMVANPFATWFLEMAAPLR